jgi:hypothetical protein
VPAHVFFEAYPEIITASAYLQHMHRDQGAIEETTSVAIYVLIADGDMAVRLVRDAMKRP